MLQSARDPAGIVHECRSLDNEQDLEALRRLEICVLSNAIETFEVRLRNVGFAGPGLHVRRFSTMVGYATTARVRSSEPPMAGRTLQDRSDWSILAVPYPRIAVLEDMDDPAGIGALRRYAWAMFACVCLCGVRDWK